MEENQKHDCLSGGRLDRLAIDFSSLQLEYVELIDAEYS